MALAIWSDKHCTHLSGLPLMPLPSPTPPEACLPPSHQFHLLLKLSATADKCPPHGNLHISGVDSCGSMGMVNGVLSSKVPTQFEYSVPSTWGIRGICILQQRNFDNTPSAPKTQSCPWLKAFVAERCSSWAGFCFLWTSDIFNLHNLYHEFFN